MAEMRRKRRLEDLKRLEEEEKKRQTIELKKKKESRWEMARWCHKFLEDNTKDWEREKLQRIEERKKKIADWERKSRLEKIKHLKDKLKSKPDDENEDDELARVAALTEENWRNWRRKEVEIENSEELDEEDYEEVEDYQQVSEERREDGKEEASWGDEEESKELVEIQTQLEENQVGYDEEYVELPDLGESEELCPLCVYRPCLCTLLKLEMKIKMLQEEQEEKKEEEETKKKSIQERKEDGEDQEARNHGKAFQGRIFKVVENMEEVTCQIPSLVLDCNQSPKPSAPPPPPAENHHQTLEVIPCNQSGKDSQIIRNTDNVRKMDGNQYHIVEELINDLITKSVQNYFEKRKEGIFGARPKEGKIMSTQPEKLVNSKTNKLKPKPKPKLVTQTNQPTILTHLKPVRLPDLGQPSHITSSIELKCPPTHPSTSMKPPVGNKIPSSTIEKFTKMLGNQRNQQNQPTLPPTKPTLERNKSTSTQPTRQASTKPTNPPPQLTYSKNLAIKKKLSSNILEKFNSMLAQQPIQTQTENISAKNRDKPTHPPTRSSCSDKNQEKPKNVIKNTPKMKKKIVGRVSQQESSKKLGESLKLWLSSSNTDMEWSPSRGGSTGKNSSNNQTTTVMPTILPLRARQTVKKVERIVEDHHDDAGVDDA